MHPRLQEKEQLVFGKGSFVENIAVIALSNQMVLRRQMDIIANNIANVSTPGFKGQNMAFKEFLDEEEAGAEATSYVQEMGIGTDFAQGPMTNTGGDYDLAINGDGFFSIGTAVGTRYTRNGNFRLDGNGQIVNGNGDPLLSDNGRPIVVPSAAEKVVITQDGTLYADGAVIGRVGLVRFNNPAQLSREDGGFYAIPANIRMQPVAVANPRIYQGMLEASNVEGVMEITKMMQVARAYESAQKVIDKEDDRVRNAIRRLTQTQ